MKKWVILCALCLLPLLYPCDELLCWDTAGGRFAYWSETSCDGYSYSGTWTGYVTNDCRFVGTGEWESVTGTVDPYTGVLTATGAIREECGPVTMNGNFDNNLISVLGSYNHSKGGEGYFAGRIQP